MRIALELAVLVFFTVAVAYLLRRQRLLEHRLERQNKRIAIHMVLFQEIAEELKADIQPPPEPPEPTRRHLSVAPPVAAVAAGIGAAAVWTRQHPAAAFATFTGLGALFVLPSAVAPEDSPMARPPIAMPAPEQPAVTPAPTERPEPVPDPPTAVPNPPTVTPEEPTPPQAQPVSDPAQPTGGDEGPPPGQPPTAPEQPPPPGTTPTDPAPAQPAPSEPPPENEPDDPPEEGPQPTCWVELQPAGLVEVCVPQLL